MQQDSPIVSGLKGLGADVCVFSWSGRNRHGARTKAGVALRDELLGIIETHPSRPIHLVGHSHGGNVALYALASDDPALASVAVTTMATPFVSVEELRWPRRVWVLLAIMAVLTTGAWVPAFASGLSGIGVWQLRFTPMMIATSLLLVDIVVHLALLARRPAPQELVARSPGAKRLLTIAGLGDEAASVLLVSSFAGRMTRRLSELAAFLPMLGLSFVVWIVGVVVLGIQTEPGDAESVFQSLAIWVPLIAPTVILLVFYAAQLVVGLDGLGYGMSYLFTVDSSPVGLSISARVKTPPGAETVHALYEWPETLEWILWHVKNCRNPHDGSIVHDDRLIEAIRVHRHRGEDP